MANLLTLAILDSIYIIYRYIFHKSWACQFSSNWVSWSAGLFSRNLIQALVSIDNGMIKV